MSPAVHTSSVCRHLRIAMSFWSRSLRMFWCKRTLSTTLMRRGWLHYFMQFRQLGSLLCRQLYPLLSLESSGVENNVSLCDRNPIPEMLNAYPEEENIRTDYALIKSPNPVLLNRASQPAERPNFQLLQTSTSVQMMEFASAATTYFFFLPL